VFRDYDHSKLTLEQFNQVNVSFHVFPEDLSPRNPLSSNDPDAPVLAPRKPKPHLRAGSAIAVPEPPRESATTLTTTCSRPGPARFDLLLGRVQFGSPTSRATLEHVPVAQESVKHGANCGRVAEQFAPVFHWSVGGQNGAGALIAAHNDFQQFFGGSERQLAHD
jgi:hypothetical protein